MVELVTACKMGQVIIDIAIEACRLESKHYQLSHYQLSTPFLTIP